MRRQSGPVGRIVSVVLIVTGVLAVAGVGSVLTASKIGDLLREPGREPPKQVSFSAQIAADIYAATARCPAADAVLTHGTSGDVPPFGAAVRWYRAVAWTAVDADAANVIADRCLRIRPLLSEQVWSSASWYDDGQGWAWGRASAMIADDAFGPTPANDIVRSELVQRQHGLFRFVYVSRSPDRTTYGVHVYMYNWD